MEPVYNLKTGDVLCAYGRGFVSSLISWLTPRLSFWRAAPSHVAIIIIHGGEAVVFECTTMNARPDYLDGKRRAGVQAHRFEEWRRDYDGKVWLHRLRTAMTPRGVQDCRDYAIEAHERQVAYDMRSAIHSATPINNTENGEAMFCSAFVAFCLRAGRAIGSHINASEIHPCNVRGFPCLDDGVQIK